MLPTLRNGSGLARAEYAPVNRLAPLFDRFFDDIFTSTSAPSWSGLPMSMWEDENHLYVEMDAPGVKEEDIDISVHNGVLAIKGERKNERQKGGYDSRSYGRFEQRISLPSPVDVGNVDAKLTNGVLCISFPKSEEAKPRKIALKKSE